MTAVVTIAFQGAMGAFSHSAALAFANDMDFNARFLPCQTFGEVFLSVLEGRATYGAIPLENSSIGSIVANYDLLWENPAAIVAEHYLPVHHQLIGFPSTKIEQIDVVFSHPAALDQCRKLFKTHKNLASRVHWDTSGSVLNVKESGVRSHAAIAGELAAKEYGMEIIAANIEDYPVNATRFGLICPISSTGGKLPEPLIGKNAQKRLGLISAGKSGAHHRLKASFAAELTHEAGALSCLLAAIASFGANLTKIESRPIGETPWHYRFFMDVEVFDEEMESDLHNVMQGVSLSFKPLGRYIAASNPS